MKVTRFLLSAVLLFAVAGNSYAIDRQGGTIQLSWDVCNPVIPNKNMLSGPNHLYASVLGQNVGHQAYQIWLVIGNSSNHLPDAWRFDTTAGNPGCNAGFSGTDAYPYNNQPPAALSKACPAFVPIAVSTSRIHTYQFAPAPLGFATTLGNSVAAYSYSNGGAGSPNFVATTRYHLVDFLYDHTFSLPGPQDPAQACGGFEQGMCIYAVDAKCSWLDLQSVEHLFNDGTSGRSVTYNGGTGGAGCPGTIPAQPATWGQIKAQYKH